MKTRIMKTAFIGLLTCTVAFLFGCVSYCLTGCKDNCPHDYPRASKSVDNKSINEIITKYEAIEASSDEVRKYYAIKISNAKDLEKLIEDDNNSKIILTDYIRKTFSKYIFESLGDGVEVDDCLKYTLQGALSDNRVILTDSAKHRIEQILGR
jgi:nickel-dependent lactate racemase